MASNLYPAGRKAIISGLAAWDGENSNIGMMLYPEYAFNASVQTLDVSNQTSIRYGSMPSRYWDYDQNTGRMAAMTSGYMYATFGTWAHYWDTNWAVLIYCGTWEAGTVIPLVHCGMWSDAGAVPNGSYQDGYFTATFGSNPVFTI